MKKNCIIILCLCIIILSYNAYNYYCPPQLHECSCLNMQGKSDTIFIAYIGDSWAYYHQNHECQIERIISPFIQRPVKVHSYGICGLTSKEIYNRMFNDKEYMQFLKKRNYAYCFISAGINDTYKKMSPLYYKKSMEGIIKLLLFNHIHPIILEIPDYNIDQAYEWQTPTKKTLRKISSFINHTPIDCKLLFRETLNELIKENGYTDSVSVVKFKEWNRNFTKDLQALYKKDGMHLNDNGYRKLDSIIAHKIKIQHKDSLRVLH